MTKKDPPNYISACAPTSTLPPRHFCAVCGYPLFLSCQHTLLLNHYLLWHTYLVHCERGGVTQWVARLTRNVEVMGSNPIKGPRRFLEQETLPFLLSTGWFPEQIRA